MPQYSTRSEYNQAVNDRRAQLSGQAQNDARSRADTGLGLSAVGNAIRGMYNDQSPGTIATNAAADVAGGLASRLGAIPAVVSQLARTAYNDRDSTPTERQASLENTAFNSILSKALMATPLAPLVALNSLAGMIGKGFNPANSLFGKYSDYVGGRYGGLFGPLSSSELRSVAPVPVSDAYVRQLDDGRFNQQAFDSNPAVSPPAVTFPVNLTDDTAKSIADYGNMPTVGITSTTDSYNPTITGVSPVSDPDSYNPTITGVSPVSDPDSYNPTITGVSPVSDPDSYGGSQITSAMPTINYGGYSEGPQSPAAPPQVTTAPDITGLSYGPQSVAVAPVADTPSIFGPGFLNFGGDGFFGGGGINLGANAFNGGGWNGASNDADPDGGWGGGSGSNNGGGPSGEGGSGGGGSSGNRG